MAKIKDAYTVTVAHGERSLSAVVGAQQVEEWLANVWSRTEVTGSLSPVVLTEPQRALLHDLVREVMGGPA